MKVNYILIVLLIGLFYSSCKKENQNNLTLDTFEATKIYAGVSDTSLFNYTFINPMSVNVIFDTSNLYGYGATVIDFDLNGTNDLTVIMNLINQDSIHLLNGSTPNPLPNCSIESSSSLAVAMLSQELIVNGSPTTYYWCDTITEGQEVGDDLEWSSVNTELNLWIETNGSNTGSWFLIGGVSYIGIKFNDKYGWLEVDATDPLNPLFTKFAMQR
jgi:hypothetical protein